ncbi:MAG: plasmid stabilization protein [Spirochaetaceae bacterium]|nr:MAG: plasmid stabilization protein [Spirochaetaceae bacterium]
MYTIKLTPVAAEYINKLDKKSQTQIIKKIEVLKNNPTEVGKQLKGNLKDYRSTRSIGQRYRIIYKIMESQILVVIVAIGIRKDGDKKDIYELMKKYVKIGLFNQ